MGIAGINNEQTFHILVGLQVGVCLSLVFLSWWVKANLCGKTMHFPALPVRETCADGEEIADDDDPAESTPSVGLDARYARPCGGE